MILSCNSCEKKFVVPNNAIGPLGRMVQCSSCGNKWKQFPDTVKNKKLLEQEEELKKVKPVSIVKKKKNKKRAGPNLYSPEYLAKKHGLKIGKNPIQKDKKIKDKSKIGFGFYNYLIIFIVFITFILKLLYFTKENIIEIFPVSQIYIDHLFETIKNIKEILLNFY